MSLKPIYDLRPLAIGELLDYSLRIYQRTFPFIAIPAAISSGFVDFPSDYVKRITDSTVEVWDNQPMDLADRSWADITILILDRTGTDLTWSTGFGWGECSLILVAVLLYSFVRFLSYGYSSAVVYGAVANRIIGAEVTWQRLREFAMRFGWRDFQLTLLQHLVLYAPFVPGELLRWLARYAGDDFALFTGSFLAQLPAIPIFFWGLSFLPLSDTVLVVEDLQPVAAIRRTYQLTQGHRWRIFGIFVLAVILLSLFEAALSSSSTWLLSIPFPNQALAIEMITETITSVLLWPLFSVLSTLLYFDLRVRKEQFDMYFLLGDTTGQSEITDSTIASPTMQP